MNVQFDTLKYSQSLEQAGVEREQAEAYSKAIVELVDDNLVTKHDLRVALDEFKTELKKEFATKEDLKVLKAELKEELGIEIVKATSQVKMDLVKWIAASMITLLLSQFGLALTLIKFLSP